MPPGDVLDRIHVEVALHEYAALQGGKITQEAADRLSEQLCVHLLADARAIWYAFLRVRKRSMAAALVILAKKGGRACGR